MDMMTIAGDLESAGGGDVLAAAARCYAAAVWSARMPIAVAPSPLRACIDYASLLIQTGRQLKNWLDSLWHRGAAFYLGEWHFHPYASARPSGTDQQQMRDIARSDRYRCPEPVLVIVGGDPSAAYELSVSVFSVYGTAITRVAPSNAEA